MTSNIQTRQFITIQGIKTAYLIHGSGEPLLMLHGWGASIDLLLPLAEMLAKQGYACTMLDMPGFGETEPPPVAWSIHDYAAYAMAFADACELETFYLFGHSFGGRLGLILGAEQAGRIRKMVLADAAGIRDKTPITTQLRLPLYKSIRDGLKVIGLRSLSDSLRGWYSRRYGSVDFQAASGVMRETMVKVVNEDLSHYAPRVRPSTLLLWGELDEDTPLWQGKQLEATIPDAGLVVYEGAGHYSYLDRLHDTVRVIDYFFKQG